MCLAVLSDDWSSFSLCSVVLSDGWSSAGLCSAVLSDGWIVLVCVQQYCWTAGLVLEQFGGRLV